MERFKSKKRRKTPPIDRSLSLFFFKKNRAPGRSFAPLPRSYPSPTSVFLLCFLSFTLTLSILPCEQAHKT